MLVLCMFSMAKLTAQPKQLNVSILIDLSDRIRPQKNVVPTQADRDIEVVKTITEAFKNEMRKQGAFFSSGKIRVFFHPSPKNNSINEVINKLTIDLNGLKPAEKKVIYKNITSNFEEQLTSIYQNVIDEDSYFGSDIWRFFKNDVKDFCINESLEYRNILVILTDGYVYHQDSKDRIKNKTAYITPGFISREGFRNNVQWETKYSRGKYGLLCKRKDLENLEVLVLEIAPSNKAKNDEDVIRRYLSDWFEDMGITRYALYNTDIPANTKIRILNYLKQ